GRGCHLCLTISDDMDGESGRLLQRALSKEHSFEARRMPIAVETGARVILRRTRPRLPPSDCICCLWALPGTVVLAFETKGQPTLWHREVQFLGAAGCARRSRERSVGRLVDPCDNSGGRNSSECHHSCFPA